MGGIVGKKIWWRPRADPDATLTAEVLAAHYVERWERNGDAGFYEDGHWVLLVEHTDQSLSSLRTGLSMANRFGSSKREHMIPGSGRRRPRGIERPAEDGHGLSAHRQPGSLAHPQIHGRCNPAVGYLRDSADLARKVAVYLDQHEEAGG